MAYVGESCVLEGRAEGKHVPPSKALSQAQQEINKSE
eukprot:CAMPEP_0201478550 /NCGR_PEP_ID=MMETSP0151_2-20130828/3357_1 /ASSEMBLY_ACC=CAM_ASM_000257 /TAXON_ID=200890 /ORGANISM="Paramoeba atlantica, Strain 621/1 / CCAP 1560/9" /LENGTH=36 /DNA_ID= /DNA_START= /DNA_END= /DNA_ORIENTATION=